MYKNTINKSIPCYNEDNDEPSYQLRFGGSDGDVSSWKMCCIYEKAKIVIIYCLPMNIDAGVPFSTIRTRMIIVIVYRRVRVRR